MSFISYCRDQGKLLIFYLVLMTFVSVVMLLSGDGGQAGDNVFYINLLGLVLLSFYLIRDYLREKSFYNEIRDMAVLEQKGHFPLTVRHHSNQQKLYLELLKANQKQFDEQLQKLQAEKKDHQDFILSWIHEVKLPIAASRLVIDNSSDKSVDYLADKLEDELNKIDNYVEQALYYSRIDSFSNDYFITEVELNQLIKNCVKKFAKIFINKQIRFLLFEQKQFCNSDVKWLSYILEQIISNSLKYTGSGGMIRFEYEEDLQEKRIHIIDSGIGIAKEDIGRVFEKGFTGQVGRNYPKSTGMGLYLAKQMAMKLGHELSIQSVEGEYTKVTIHFPKTRSYMEF
jgi:signal transduction histidine kinase